MPSRKTPKLSRLALVAVLAAHLLACSGQDGKHETPDTTDTTDVPDGAPIALDELLFDETAPPLMEIAGQGPQTVFVSFEGQRVEDCDNSCSDATANRSFAIGHHWGVPAVDFAPYAGDEPARTRIIEGLRAAFAAYAVDFTTTRPTQGPYTMLIVSAADGPGAGIAPLDCENRNPRDIAIVYKSGGASIDWLVTAGAHELGHSFGLTHVVSTDDTMHWLGAGDAFTIAGYDADHANAKCFAGATQDGPALLLAALGPRAPQPPTWDGTFADDDGNTHEAAIEALVGAGVTQGCAGGGAPRFCPDARVTRGQMVVFLQRALVLPPSSTDAFSDDNDAWYEEAANACAAAGISEGCGGGLFCGEQTVTRAQLASFLARGFDLPPAAYDYFADDTGSPHEANINRVAQAGVTLGCGATAYCPDGEVRRDQMASFLARALGLLTTTHASNRVTVPIGGNAWILDGGTGTIGESGVLGWSTPGSTVRTYFRVDRPGTLHVSATVVGNGGEVELALSIAGASRALAFSGGDEHELFAGVFEVDAAGYVAVDLTGVSSTASTFGQPTAIHVSGSAVSPAMSYVPNNDGDMFYFGRRGPSTHLQWGVPAGTNLRWLYSELTVPTGEDVVGSYFMANGFDGGYFGMQVNSTQRRQFLFSVWSPYQTDDPTAIPPEYRVATNRSGPGVVVGEFGNEGAGGQSYFEFDWSAGATYRFLTEVRPNGDNTTDYTAWVYLPEEAGWRLIASFRRPFTHAYAGSPYSFLENFNPEQGDETRSAHYHGQWVANDIGAWSEVRRLTFTVDDTGRQGFRKDFAGGLSNGQPFLRNCGFFDDWAEPGTVFERAPSAGQPDVDLGALP